MIITKEFITELKHKENGEIASLIRNYRDIGTINFILESLGQLPSSFNSSFLYDLLKHKHAQVRLNAVKNIGKLKGKTDIAKLSELYKKETDTTVKREIISSIGRQRNLENKPLLFEFLEDEDPKIVCQAIRGLLVFGKDNDVINHLKPLINHPNEMVRTVIYKEYFAKENQSKSVHAHAETYDFLKNTIVNADVMMYRKQTEKLLDWNIRSYDYKTVEKSKVADGYENTNVWKIDLCFDKDNLGVPLSGRDFRSNLFARSSQKGFPLQSLTHTTLKQVA